MATMILPQQTLEVEPRRNCRASCYNPLHDAIAGDLSQLATLALLFAASWLAATVSGVAGFGGALLLPILTNLVGVKAAVPILTIAQLWGNGSRVWFGRTEIRWRPVFYFIVTAIPFSIAGGMLFVDLPRQRTRREEHGQWPAGAHRETGRVVIEKRTKPSQHYLKSHYARSACCGTVTQCA